MHFKWIHNCLVQIKEYAAIHYQHNTLELRSCVEEPSLVKYCFISVLSKCSYIKKIFAFAKE